MTSAAPTPEPEPEPWHRRLLRGEVDARPRARTRTDEAARIEADTERRLAQQERDRAEAARQRADALRVAAETTAFNALRERDEALARLKSLENQLVVPPTPPVEPEPVRALDPESAPSPPTEEPVRDEPVRVERVSTSEPAGSSPVLTVLLGLAALVATGVAVHQAYLDRLTGSTGVVACLVALVLAIVVGRARPHP